MITKRISLKQIYDEINYVAQKKRDESYYYGVLEK
jgi:hypothetical protein